MASKIGNKDVIARYIGNNKVIKQYLGTQVLYEYIPEDTGTTTYADDALVFEFTGTSLTYKLNNKTYTATTSPTIVNLSDLGYDANTTMIFHDLFYNQTNLTKVLHFPKITGTNNIGYSLFNSCKNVEYIDLSNIGNLNSLHLQFDGCTSLKNLNMDNVDLSNSDYEIHNSTFDNVPNDIQISMNGCNCESIVTIKQALNDVGIVTYNNNVVTNNNCIFEPYETVEYNVNFHIDEWETYDEELKADSIDMIVYNYNEYGVSSYTENDIREEVSYEYEQIEEYGEDKIKCTIYYNGNNIYEITYKGTLPNTDTDTDTSACALSCDTDKTIPMQKFYINWYKGIEQPGNHFIGFHIYPNMGGDCENCDWNSFGTYICPSECSYCKPNGAEGNISDLPKEGDYYVLDMEETVYFMCGEKNALFDHVFYCKPNIVDGSIVTENTLSFKYEINGILTKSNISINGTSYSFNETNGESLGDGFYKATITPTEKITTFKFVNGNVCELYAIPDSLTSLNDTFVQCTSLSNINLKGLDTSNLTSMDYTFLGLVSFNGEPNIIIDVTGWDISKVVSNLNTFRNSTGIKTLILGEVSQTTYNFWYARLFDADLQEQVTIDCTIV